MSEIQRYDVQSLHRFKHPKGNMVMFRDAERDKAAAVVREQEKAVRAMRLLESLTPGGSEYHNDPERCASYVRDRIDTLLDHVVGARVREKNAVAKAVKEERERMIPVMTPEQECAFGWAINQQYQSVAARYARLLAEYIYTIRSIQAQKPDYTEAAKQTVASWPQWKREIGHQLNPKEQ